MRLFSTAKAKFAFDQVLIEIPSKEKNGHIYLTWQPVKATAQLKGATGQKLDVTLRNAGKSAGGKVAFGDARSDTVKTELTLTLTGDAPGAEFWIAGKEASSEDGDAAIEAVAPGGATLAVVPMMVRIRKDAEALTRRERDRFLWALARLDAGGASSAFMILRKIHGPFVGNSMDDEAHHMPAFLPWHRAYMLDLERELQAVDPSVTLPYWRFDRKAPKLLNPNFMGKQGFPVPLAPGHPLEFWSTEKSGFDRVSRSIWDPSTGPADVRDEDETLGLSKAYKKFRRKMERDPHDYIHMSWAGDFYFVPTAPNDPLFFLFHANIDRLWAKWQMPFSIRKNAADAHGFSPQPPKTTRIGHNRDDTMWPWDGSQGALRPNSAPGGTLADSEITTAPGGSPKVADMIDYQGIHSGVHLGFDYDDVPFQRGSDVGP